MKLTLNLPAPKRLAVLLGLLGFVGAAYALSYQAVSDAPQTFSNDKTLNGSWTINQGSTTNNPALLVNGDAGITGNVNLGGPGAVINIDGGVTIQGALTLPATAAAGAVSYFAGGPPEALFGVGSLTYSNATKLGGYLLPANDAFTFTAMTGAMSTASAGTGSVTVTLTDGTNTCTFTGTCSGAPPTTGFAGNGAYRMAATAGAGTGCVYAKGAAITASVSASNCGTTTPIGFANFEGTWQ